MKITKIEYVVNGAMGIKHKFLVIATDGGLEKALKYTKDFNVTSTTEEEVVSVQEYYGSSSNRFKTYFMDGAKAEKVFNHYATGSVFSVIYS